jgi:hypothetical protein
MMKSRNHITHLKTLSNHLLANLLRTDDVLTNKDNRTANRILQTFQERANVRELAAEYGVPHASTLPWRQLIKAFKMQKQAFFASRAHKEARLYAATEMSALRRYYQSSNTSRRLVTDYNSVLQDIKSSPFEGFPSPDATASDLVDAGHIVRTGAFGLVEHHLTCAIYAIKNERITEPQKKRSGHGKPRTAETLLGRANLLWVTLDAAIADGAKPDAPTGYDRRSGRLFVVEALKELRKLLVLFFGILRERYVGESRGPELIERENALKNSITGLFKSSFHGEENRSEEEFHEGIRMTSVHDDNGSSAGLRGLIGHGNLEDEDAMREIEFFNSRFPRSEFGSNAEEKNLIRKIQLGRKFIFLFQGFCRHRHYNLQNLNPVYHRGSSRGLCLTTMFTFGVNVSEQEAASVTCAADAYLHNIEALLQKYFPVTDWSPV